MFTSRTAGNEGQDGAGRSTVSFFISTTTTTTTSAGYRRKKKKKKKKKKRERERDSVSERDKAAIGRDPELIQLISTHRTSSIVDVLDG